MQYFTGSKPHNIYLQAAERRTVDRVSPCDVTWVTSSNFPNAAMTGDDSCS